SAQIREILISESAWEEMTCLFAPSLTSLQRAKRISLERINVSSVNSTASRVISRPL
ncbi:type VII secretion system (T7SS), usher family protein, partial [Klebsiella pneumoniae subsp. pneumoniae]